MILVHVTECDITSLAYRGSDNPMTISSVKDNLAFDIETKEASYRYGIST